MAIPVFGKEQYPLRKESGLSYTISDIYKHVPLHTHNHYELFIISEGTAYHLINDSVQTVKKGQHFSMKADKIRPSDKLYKLVSVEELKRFKGLDIENKRG